MTTNIEELIVTMLKPLMTLPDTIKVSVVDGEEFMEYHVTVDPEDTGRIIGRQGRIIQAVRTIVYSIPVEDGAKKARVVVDQED